MVTSWFERFAFCGPVCLRLTAHFLRPRSLRTGGAVQRLLKPTGQVETELRVGSQVIISQQHLAQVLGAPPAHIRVGIIQLAEIILRRPGTPEEPKEA